MTIDSTRTDRQEERDVENRQNDNRRAVERKLQYKPMETFEAKLSEKNAQEQVAKESLARNMHDQKKTKEEKESLLGKILGVAKDKNTEAEHVRVGALHHEDNEHSAKQEDKRLGDKEFKTKDAEEGDNKEVGQKNETKEGEVSREGHKRVAEKEGETGQDAGGGGGGSDTGGSGQSGGGENSSGFGSQTGFSDKEQALMVAAGKAGVKGIGGIRGFGGGGFQGDARQFSKENLDQIVTAVELGVNEYGEQEFSVELNDDYFEGLKIQATRTDQGVVVKFVCPNVSVRSTFLKFRPNVYQQFRSKGIGVHRIDVV